MKGDMSQSSNGVSDATNLVADFHRLARRGRTSAKKIAREDKIRILPVKKSGNCNDIVFTSILFCDRIFFADMGLNSYIEKTSNLDINNCSIFMINI